MEQVTIPVLSRFRAELDRLYGERLKRVILFGSRARGDGHADSDYDVAIFLREPDRFGIEAERIAKIETDILFDTGAVINAMPFDESSYDAMTGLMMAVRRDGLDL